MYGIRTNFLKLHEILNCEILREIFKYFITIYFYF